jgi:hypothetical protein
VLIRYTCIALMVTLSSCHRQGVQLPPTRDADSAVMQTLSTVNHELGIVSAALDTNTSLSTIESVPGTRLLAKGQIGALLRQTRHSDSLGVTFSFRRDPTRAATVESEDYHIEQVEVLWSGLDSATFVQHRDRLRQMVQPTASYAQCEADGPNAMAHAIGIVGTTWYAVLTDNLGYRARRTGGYASSRFVYEAKLIVTNMDAFRGRIPRAELRGAACFGAEKGEPSLRG